jgi:putative MATE family efflux protein
MNTEKADKKAERRRERFLSEPVYRLVFQMSVPTTISQIISVIYNTADTFFVAQIGTSAAAAVGVGFSLMSIIQAIGYGFGMGAGSLISRQLGAADGKKANRSGNSALCAAFISALLFGIAGLAGLKGLMRILGSTDSMLPYSCAYAKYILAGAPVMCASFVLNIILRSEGDARYAMFGICAGGILNVGLDPLFIYVFHMGIAGAAIATILSQFISFLILLIPFLRKRSIVKLGLRWVSIHPKDYAEIIRVGFPTICRQGLASLASALLNLKASAYGDAAVAALTIANKIYLLIRNIILGIGQGYQPVAGYNYGAGKNRRAREAFVTACLLGTVISTLSSAVIFFNADSVMMWFRNDADVIAMGRIALYYACAAMPFMAYSTYVDQLYQCLGFSAGATFLACCRQGFFYIPAILILPAMIGLKGVQMAQPFADIMSFVLCIPFQIVFFRKHLTVSEQESRITGIC